MDPTFPLVPLLNFICAILTLSPLYVHTFRSKSWNIPIFAISLWTSVECIITGVNATIWSNNVQDVAPVWCDICKSMLITLILCVCLIVLLFAATHLDVASVVALRGCTFAITRRLYVIMKYKTKANAVRKVRNMLFKIISRRLTFLKRSDAILDIFTTFVLPIIVACLCRYQKRENVVFSGSPKRNRLRRTVQQVCYYRGGRLRL